MENNKHGHSKIGVSLLQRSTRAKAQNKLYAESAVQYTVGWVLLTLSTVMPTD